MTNPVQQILISGVRFYRWILSPIKTALLGPASHCRFEPSCSAYALEALRVHGACRGGWLALGRLCRCHPWGKFGPDPVPDLRRPESRITPALRSAFDERGHHASRLPSEVLLTKEGITHHASS